jgi:hypothetical protein
MNLRGTSPPKLNDNGKSTGEPTISADFYRRGRWGHKGAHRNDRKRRGPKANNFCFPTVLAASRAKISLATSVHMYNTPWKLETVTELSNRIANGGFLNNQLMNAPATSYSLLTRSPGVCIR